MIRAMDHQPNLPPSETPERSTAGRGRAYVPRYFMAPDDRLLLLRDFGTYGRAYHALFAGVLPHWMFRKFTAEGCGCRMHDEVARKTQATIDAWRATRETISFKEVASRLPLGAS